jgi:hypothetical protein
VRLFAIFLNIKLSPSRSAFGKTKGLCGNWDCDPANDILALKPFNQWGISVDASLFVHVLKAKVDVDIGVDIDLSCSWGPTIIDDIVIPALNRTAALACCLKTHPILATNLDELADCILDVVIEGDEFTCKGDLVKGEFCEECFPPCLGNFHCDKTSGAPKCVCDPGFSGVGCLISDEACSACNKPNQLCLNGVCTCKVGFVGKNCRDVITLPDLGNNNDDNDDEDDSWIEKCANVDCSNTPANVRCPPGVPLVPDTFSRRKGDCCAMTCRGKNLNPCRKTKCDPSIKKNLKCKLGTVACKDKKAEMKGKCCVFVCKKKRSLPLGF